MAGTASGEICSDSHNELKWLQDDMQANSPPDFRRKKSTPSWPGGPMHPSHHSAHQESSGQTLQGDYLSPEQPSYGPSSTSSPENRRRVRVSGDSKNFGSFKLHRCSPEDGEELGLKGPDRLSYLNNRELQDDQIQNLLIGGQMSNCKGKSQP